MVKCKNTMREDIFKILQAIEKQGISQNLLARNIGFPQKTVNELLSGKTKKPNIEIIEKLQKALGIVAEEGEKYGVVGIHQQVTPIEEELLRYYRQLGDTERSNVLQVIKGLLLLAQK